MSSVTYSSTRGGETHLDFRTIVMQGLARDRGLFVPDELPQVSQAELDDMRQLDFASLAVRVISKFVKDDQVPEEKLKEIVNRSCAAFDSKDVTPVVKVGDHHILELFHGPTFAFKDVALQMLGNFFEYFLETGSNGGHMAVLGATSGDTGSAAIAGLRGKKGIDCIILFPKGRVSPIQERQMTTVLDENIHCVAINGTFDDCQDLVKNSFDTPEFRDKINLGAVNSINWCRVLAQTTYYFWAYFRVTNDRSKSDVEEKVNFSVPTGNFGDVLAGYYAKRMGLPIDKLIVATNENDILHRFFTKGEYFREPIAKTISPSMDICVSSNFERYLYHLTGDKAETLSAWMKVFDDTKKLSLTGDYLKQAQADFVSGRSDTDMTLDTMKTYHSKYNYLLCPHSAVGVNVIHQLGLVNPATVCLATAHAGKFPDAVKKAVTPLPPPPPQLAALLELPSRRSELPNKLARVQVFVVQKVFRKVFDPLEKEQRKTIMVILAAAVVVRLSLLWLRKV